MTYKDFQNGLKRYELEQERTATLESLEAVLTRASRSQIQQLLSLPDKIRIRHIEENPMFRAAIRNLLDNRLKGGQEVDTEKREIMQEIIEGIDKVNQITAELDALKGGGGDGNGGGAPEGGAESEKVRRVG